MLISSKTLERYVRFINNVAMKFPFFRRIVEPERRFGMETAKLLVLLKDGENDLSRRLRQELEQVGLSPDDAQSTAKRIMAPFPVMSWVLHRAKRHNLPADTFRAFRRFGREFNTAFAEALRAPFQRLPHHAPSFQASFEPSLDPDKTLAEGRRIYTSLESTLQQLRPLAATYQEHGAQGIYSDLNRMEDDEPLVRAHALLTRDVRDAFRLPKKSEAAQIATETLKLFIPHLGDTASDDPEQQRFFAESLRAMGQLNDIAAQLKHHKYPGRNAAIAQEISLLRDFNRAMRGINRELALRHAPSMIDNYLDGIGVNNLYYHTPIVRNVIDFPTPPHSAHKARLEMMQLGDMSLTYGFGDSTTNGFGYDFSSALLPQIEAGRVTLLGLGIYTQDRTLVDLQRRGASALMRKDPAYTPARIAAMEHLYFKYGTYSNHDFMHVSMQPIKFVPNVAWLVTGNEEAYRGRLIAEFAGGSIDVPLLKKQLDLPKAAKLADITARLGDPAFLQSAIDTPVVRAVLGRGLVAYNDEWSMRLNTRFFGRNGLQADVGDNPKDHLVLFRDKAAFFGMAGLELWSMMVRTEMFHRELGYQRGKPMAEQKLVGEKLAEYTGEMADYLTFVHDRTRALADSDPARAADAYRMAGNDLREFVYQSMWVIPPDVIQVAVDAFTRAHPDFRFPVRHPGAYGHYDDTAPEMQMTVQSLLDLQRQDWTGQIHELKTVQILDETGATVAEKTPVEIIAEFSNARTRLVIKQAINELLGLRYEPLVSSDSLRPYGTLDRMADFMDSARDGLAAKGIDVAYEKAMLKALRRTLLNLDAAMISAKPIAPWKVTQLPQRLGAFGKMLDRVLNAAAALDLSPAEQPYNLDRDIIRNQVNAFSRVIAAPSLMLPKIKRPAKPETHWTPGPPSMTRR